MNRFESSGKAIKQNIYRLKSKNQLAHVRKEFYVIVPPQYSNRGMVPSTLFIDDLMKYLKRDYYVGLLSAAALHGAGHQQPMQFQVMTKKPPLRSIKNKKLDIRFFVKSKWLDGDIEENKTETGYINVSSPALTAFDLVHYNKKIGGLNRIIPILEDLSESIRSPDLKRTASHQKVPVMQRLGYLFEQLGNEKLASVLYKRVDRKPLREIPISLAHKNREGELISKWNVILNTELDF
ncbi:MAG: hypothetical protein HKN87_13905 [Saprospiraceae bacterium]|nr:hypothetical protein [Saprospiraceae bacterium]